MTHPTPSTAQELLRLHREVVQEAMIVCGSGNPNPDPSRAINQWHQKWKRAEAVFEATLRAALAQPVREDAGTDDILSWLKTLPTEPTPKLREAYEFCQRHYGASLPSAPVGWVCVPREPTQEQVQAALDDHAANAPYESPFGPDGSFARQYRAMLSAAPSATADVERVKRLTVALYSIPTKTEEQAGAIIEASARLLQSVGIEPADPDDLASLPTADAERATVERLREAERWEQFAQNAENTQNQAPYKHQPGWKYACCEFARQARDIRDELRALAADEKERRG